MTVAQDILEGYAGIISAAGIAAWDTAGVYQTTDTALYVKTLPDGDLIPDRAVALTFVPLTDDVSQPEGRALMEVGGRGVRGNPFDVDVLMDAVFDTLQARLGDVFGTTEVMQIFRHGSTPVGQDSQSRWLRIDKYLIDYSQAPTVRRPAGGFWD